MPTLVPIVAVGPGGVPGLATLSPTADGAAQVRIQTDATGAGRQVSVFGGTCESLTALVEPIGVIDPDTLGVPLTTLITPVATLTDGGHGIVIHPSLFDPAALGCGTIPVGLGSGLAPSPACEGVAEWADATTGRVNRIFTALTSLDRPGTAPNLTVLFESLIGTIDGLIAEQMTAPVPAALQATHDSVVEAMSLMARAVVLGQSAWLTSDVVTQEEAFNLRQEAQRSLTESLGDIRSASEGCR